MVASRNSLPKIQAKETTIPNTKVQSDVKISASLLLSFTEALRDQISANPSLIDSLRHIQKVIKNKKFALVLDEITTDVSNGKTLSYALSKFPKIFTSEYISLIKAAENSSNWTSTFKKGIRHPGILDILINYLRRGNDVRTKLIAGLTYPIFVLLLVIILSFIFLIFVTPAIKQILISLGNNQKMNFFVEFTFWAADLAANYWWLTPIILAGIVIALITWVKSDSGKRLLQTIEMRLPLFKDLFHNLYVAETFQLMGILIGAAIDTYEVLESCINASKNHEVAAGLKKAKEEVLQGISLDTAVANCHKIFEDIPNLVLSSALKAGNLDEALANYAEQLFLKVDRGIDQLMKMVEPASIVVIGGGVLFILLSFYNLIFSMSAPIH